MKILLKEYNAKKIKTFEDVIDLHQRFEVIHPFQDGNGRVGRLLMFKECLANGFVPFIITDELKMFYCRGTSVVAANQRISARYLSHRTTTKRSSIISRSNISQRNFSTEQRKDHPCGKYMKWRKAMPSARRLL